MYILHTTEQFECFIISDSHSLQVSFNDRYIIFDQFPYKMLEPFWCNWIISITFDKNDYLEYLGFVLCIQELIGDVFAWVIFECIRFSAAWCRKWRCGICFEQTSELPAVVTFLLSLSPATGIILAKCNVWTCGKDTIVSTMVDILDDSMGQILESSCEGL